MQKYILLASLAVVVLIGVIFFSTMPRQKVIKKPTINDSAKVVKTEVEKQSLPSKFPVDLPQETGAVILQNNEQFASDGRFQATRVYVTTLSLAQNLTNFQEYFKKNNWEVTATINQDNFKSISASKDGLNIQVGVNNNTVTKQKTVTIYVVEQIPVQP